MSHLKRKKITNCGKVVEERSILLWKRGAIESKKTLKGSKKVSEDFIQWLRTNVIASENVFIMIVSRNG